MWIMIYDDNGKLKNEINVWETTDRLGDILISLGKSINKRDDGLLENKIPDTGVEPQDVREWLKELSERNPDAQAELLRN